MTTEGRIRGLVATIANISDPQQISLTADIYRDIGVRSTAALDLLLTLEEQFEVHVPDEAFGEARTVDGLTQLINSILGVQRDPGDATKGVA